MVEKKNEGLLLMIAEPLDVAKQLCERMLEMLGVVGDAHLLHAAPAMVKPIRTMLAHKDVRVKRLPAPGCTMSVPKIPATREGGVILRRQS